MSFRTSGLLWIAVLLGFGVTLVGALTLDRTDVRLRSVEYKGLKMQMVHNSETLSLALAINGGGSIIGYKEVPNEDQTIFSHVYFHCGKLKSKDMPCPKGFTNVEAAALSDNESVVGRATRPIGNQDGSIRAVVWKPEKDDQVHFLPRPDGDLACDAQDISADGRLVTGYSTGMERLRPVVWSWDSQQDQWSVTVLPVLHDYNPYLMSAQLVISPDGKTIAGCCTENFLPDGSIDSGLFIWQEQGGKWERNLLTADQLYVKAINNRGHVVGSFANQQGRQPCVVTEDGKLQKLQLLPGDVNGEARDINSNSEVVGWSDDPPGTDGGPAPCRWKVDGTVSAVELSESGYGSVYSVNDSGQLAGMVDLIVPGEADNPENEKVLVLAFRTVRQTDNKKIPANP